MKTYWAATATLLQRADTILPLAVKKTKDLKSWYTW